MRLEDIFKEAINFISSDFILNSFLVGVEIAISISILTLILKLFSYADNKYQPISENRFLIRFDRYAETIMRLCPRQEKKVLTEKITMWRSEFEDLLKFIYENKLFDRQIEANERLDSIREKLKKITPRFVLFGRGRSYAALKDEERRLTNELTSDLYQPITQLIDILSAMDDLGDQLMSIAAAKQAHKKESLAATINEHALKFQDYLNAWREVKGIL